MLSFINKWLTLCELKKIVEEYKFLDNNYGVAIYCYQDRDQYILSIDSEDKTYDKYPKYNLNYQSLDVIINNNEKDMIEELKDEDKQLKLDEVLEMVISSEDPQKTFNKLSSHLKSNSEFLRCLIGKRINDEKMKKFIDHQLYGNSKMKERTETYILKELDDSSKCYLINNINVPEEHYKYFLIENETLWDIYNCNQIMSSDEVENINRTSILAGNKTLLNKHYKYFIKTSPLWYRDYLNDKTYSYGMGDIIDVIDTLYFEEENQSWDY